MLLKMEPFRVRALAAASALAAVGFAYGSQHLWSDVLPCAWCALQRLLFLALALSLAGDSFLESRRLRIEGAATIRTSRLPELLLRGAAMLLAILGLTAALWQALHASKAASCSRSLAEQVLSALMLPEAWPGMFAPYANCNESSGVVLGLPWPMWSAVLFGAILYTTFIPHRSAR